MGGSLERVEGGERSGSDQNASYGMLTRRVRDAAIPPPPVCARVCLCVCACMCVNKVFIGHGVCIVEVRGQSQILFLPCTLFTMALHSWVC